MDTGKKKVSSGVLKPVRKQFIAGLVVVVPLGITYLVLSWLFHLVDGIFEPFATRSLGKYYPGIGVAIIMVIIYILGVLTSFLPARRTIEGMLSLLLKTPIIRDIYGVSSQVMETMTQEQGDGFKRVVLVDYPRAGIKSLGFVTGHVEEAGGKKWNVIFIPATPNPTMGNMIVVEASEVTETDISLENALKMIMSAGTMVSKGLKV